MTGLLGSYKAPHTLPVFAGRVGNPGVLQVENNIMTSLSVSRQPVFTGVQNDTRVHGP